MLKYDEETITVTCQLFPDLGDGYQFNTSDGDSLAILNPKNMIMVSMEVRAYDFDSTFTIVSQQPWDDPSIIGLDEMNLPERDEAFEESTFRQYWIINKKEKNKYVG